MIKKYEGFLSNIFKKKVELLPLWEPKKPLISEEDIIKFSNEYFIELIDKEYTIKTKHDLNDELYVQITKQRRRQDIPYKFIDVKDDVLSFSDRLKLYDINVEYSFVYENNNGGLSLDSPKYEELESGDYDNREVSILTLRFI